MWPCGPARAFRRGARPVHGAARPPTAGRAQDRPDPPQIRPAGAQTRWPWLGSSAAPRGRGWASARPNCTAAMAAAAVRGRMGKSGGGAAGGREGADRKRPALCHQRAGQGRTHANNPRIRMVSVSPQKRRKLGSRMGRKRTQNGQKSVCSRALGRLFYPFYPKRMGPDRIGSRGGVGLANSPPSRTRSQQTRCSRRHTTPDTVTTPAGRPPEAHIKQGSAVHPSP